MIKPEQIIPGGFTSMDNVELLRLAATFPCDPRHKQLLLESADEIKRLRELVKQGAETDLSERMVAAGMIAYDQLGKPNAMSPWMRYPWVKDAETLLMLIERKHKEYSILTAAKGSGAIPANPEMDDFISGKASAYHEIAENARAALAPKESTND